MTDFTIHALYQSMSGDVTPLDYTRKERHEWTTWDWICALRDGITGDAAGSRFRIIDRVKEELNALVAARRELPGMTEEQMMARHGRRLLNIVSGLFSVSTEIGDEPVLTDAELDLVNAAIDEADTDSEDEIRAAEQQLRFERFRLDASHYITERLRELQIEEASEHPDEQRQMAIRAKIYVANDLRRKLEQRAGRGFPEVFSADDVERLAESMLRTDAEFHSAIQTNTNFRPVSQYDIGMPLDQPMPYLLPQAAESFANNITEHVDELSMEPNQLAHDVGDEPLHPDEAAERLQILKEVRAALDSTGTGRDWLHWISRDSNSPQYEAVRTEINRQIERLESGLPIGEPDRQRMVELLDAYTVGKENPGSTYGKTRQDNMLRLYGSYLRIDDREAVMQRYNDARGAQNADDPKYVDLTRAPYHYIAMQTPGTAGYQYEREIMQLQAQYNNALASGRPMNEREQLALRQTVLRMAALRELMTKNRTGEATPAGEQEILAAMQRIEQDPRNPYPGAIAGAVRDVRTFGELYTILEEARQDNVRLQGNYFRDRANYEDPLQRRLQELSYPTAQQLYQHAVQQLAAMELPETGALSPIQSEEYSRLARRIFTLKRIMDRRGTHYHVSTSEQMEGLRWTAENTRIREALQYLDTDAARARGFRDQLIHPTFSSARLTDQLDRHANGYIEETMEASRTFFRTIQVPQNDPPLNEENKAVMRDQIIRFAALHNLQNARVRRERFPDRAFLSDRMFSTEEIEDAMEDIRENQPEFVQAVDQQLGTAGSAKRLVNSFASERYYNTLEFVKADIFALNNTVYNDQVERPRLIASLHDRFAGLIALHNLQTAAGNLSVPVTDDALAAETARVKLSEEYLAVERMMRAGDYNAEVLRNTFSHPETLPEALPQMVQTAPVVEPRDDSLGSNYQSQLNTLATLAGPSTQERRSTIVSALVRFMAIRQMVLENPEGMYAPLNLNALTNRVITLNADPAYSQLFNRIARDPQKASDVLKACADTEDLYRLKVAQRRALAAGQAFEDPFLPAFRALADLRYNEIYDDGMNDLIAVMNTAKPGIPLNADQRRQLTRGMAQILLGRQAPDADGSKKLPEADRLRRIRELTEGVTDESRELLSAIDRVAGDGARVQDLFEVVAAPQGEMGGRIRNFARQTPAKWADDAWEKIQAFLKAERQLGWFHDETADLVNTYARMVMMRQLAKDPAYANKPISFAEANGIGQNYLNTDNNRSGLESLFINPENAIRQTLSQRINALAGLPAEARDAGALQQMMALRNLQKRYSDDAIVSQNEIIQEMTKVPEMFAYKVLTDRRNPKIPAADLSTLKSQNFDIGLEGAVFNAPARRAFVLDGAAETSPEGLCRLFAEELRHDRALGVEADAMHFAELYAVSLYADDPAWKNALPSQETISQQAQRIASLPDFRAAMRLMNDVPEYKASMETMLKNGTPAEKITAELNRYSELQRRMENSKDLRKSDLYYDVRADRIREHLKPLRSLDILKEWPSEAKAAAARTSLNAKNPGLTRDEARIHYRDFLALNRLYQRNPERVFFSDEEMETARTEVEKDKTLQKDFETVLSSPSEMRLNVFNMASAQYWSEIDAMESGRQVIVASDGRAVSVGLNTILFCLASIVEARQSGRDVTGQIVSDAELNEERNRVAFTENYIVIENALRADINELDRIKDVLKLPSGEFNAAFTKLTDEYKQKYHDVEIPDKDTLAYGYLTAKRTAASLEGKDFANDEASRRALARSVREIFTVRDMILNSRYDVATKKNTIEESDHDRMASVIKARKNAAHRMNMLLGTEAELAERFKDPQTAKAFIDLTKDAEDLRRLYGKKIEAGKSITDPLAEDLLKKDLAAKVPSHAERRAALLAEIRTAVPGETPQARGGRLQRQLASLFNLTLHAAGTDPRKMPSDAELAAQASLIMGLEDMKHAVNYLAAHGDELTAFLQKAETMDSEAFAKEVDVLSARGQHAADPTAEVFPNVMFRLKMALQNEVNDELSKSGTEGGAIHAFRSRADRDRAMERFMNYTALNRLMQKYPYRVYFSDDEISNSFLQSMKDERLMKEYQKSASGGVLGIRADLFSYAGMANVTSIKMVDGTAAYLRTPNLDTTTAGSSIEGALAQLAFLIELRKSGYLENNYYAGDMQPRIYGSFPTTPECAALKAAIMLDPMELTRISARLLPLNGKPLEEEYAKVLAEARGPVNFAGLEAREKAGLQRLITEADRQLKEYSNPGFEGQTEKFMQLHLANMLAKSLYQHLPENERPNAEAFLALRNQIRKMPEFGKAMDWYASHLKDFRELARGVSAGMAPAQFIQRLNEAAVKQQKAEKIKTPHANLLFDLQRNHMQSLRSKFWNKCGAENQWEEGVREQVHDDFLNFTAVDALIKAHPDRVFFSEEEIRAARAAFEKDPKFMASLDVATKTPHIARDYIGGFSNINFWNWTNQSFSTMKTALSVLKTSKDPNIRLQMATAVVGNLTQAAVSKLYDDVYYMPSERVLFHRAEDLLDTPGLRAMARAFEADPSQFERVVSEVYALNGPAFKSALDKLGREYLKKYPQAKADAAEGAEEHARERASWRKEKAAKAKAQANAEAKPSQAPNKAVNEANKAVNEAKNIIREPKKDGLKQDEPKNGLPKAEPLNRINIVDEPKNGLPKPAPAPNMIRFGDGPVPDEPKNSIREEPIPQSVVSKLKPLTVVVPQKEQKDTAYGQFQNTAAMLEKTLKLREDSKIPIDDANFIETAYQGTLKTLAYRNLADQKAYYQRKAGKEALNAEMERLKADKTLQPLQNAIKAGYGKTILDGIKHLEDDPKEMQGFLRRMAADPAGTKKLLEQKFQRPAPKYAAYPSLPKTEVTNDVIPKPADGKVFDPKSPAGQYYLELKSYKDAIDTAKGYGLNSLSAGYNDTIHLSILRLYALNQIMANAKDPTAPVADLESQVKQKWRELNKNPGSLRQLVMGSQSNSRFRDHVIDIFASADSFSKLSERLQSNAEKVVRRDAEAENSRIMKNNSKLIKDARKANDKDKDKNLNPEI